MIVKDFIFNDQKLSDLGYIICSFDGLSSDNQIGSRITFNSIKSGNSDYLRTTSTSFEEVITTHFCIAKYNCNNGILSNLNTEEIRKIMFWLNCHENKKLSFVDDKHGYNEVFYLGSFNAIDLIERNENIVGLDLTFVSCLPYALSQDVVLTYNLQAGDSIVIENDNDKNGYLYPTKIEICMKQGGNLLIENITTLLTTEILNCKENENITICGDSLWIESDIISHNIADDFNYNFIKLLRDNDNKNNELVFSLSCKIKITMNYIRKVGIA